MRISNDIKMRIISLIVLICLVIFSVKVVGDMLTPNTYATYLNQDYKKIKKNHEKIDLIFFGSSRIYCTFNPKIFEQELGIDNVINAASSMQSTRSTYYTLKDCIERFHPKTVILGITWDSLVNDEYDPRGELIAADRMKFINKLKLYKSIKADNNLLYMINAYRYRNRFSWETIKNYLYNLDDIIKGEIEPDTSEYGYYYYKGFPCFTDSIPQGNIVYEKSEFSVDSLNDVKMDYIKKCIELCRENDINLIGVEGVTSMSTLYSVKGYDEFNKYFEDYFAKYGYEFHNLNYLKNREELIPDTFMKDEGHLNYDGANIISPIYAKILKAQLNGENTDDYFYNSMDEVRQNVHRIVAVNAKIKGKGNKKTLKLSCAHNSGEKPMYQVEYTTNGKDFEPITDWTEDKKVKITLPDKAIKIRVFAKAKDHDDWDRAWQIYDIS